jgi:hypothetical protein
LPPLNFFQHPTHQTFSCGRLVETISALSPEIIQTRLQNDYLQGEPETHPKRARHPTTNDAAQGHSLKFANSSPRRQDILSDDEIISDSYDLKEVDGVVYEADCAMITEGAVNVGAYDPDPWPRIRESASAVVGGSNGG